MSKSLSPDKQMDSVNQFKQNVQAKNGDARRQFPRATLHHKQSIEPLSHKNPRRILLYLQVGSNILTLEPELIH